MSMEITSEVKELLDSQYGSIKEEAVRLKEKAEMLARAEKLLGEISRLLGNKYPMHILAVIDKETALLKKMREQQYAVISAVEQIYRVAKEEADRTIRNYPSLFDEACRTAGISLGTNSRHPKYNFERGFLIVEIDDKKRTARLSDYEGRLAEIPADIAALVEAMQKEHARLFKRPFNGQKFLKGIREAYKAVVKAEKRGDGESIPIRQVLKRQGRNSPLFRSDEFLVDLSRLAIEGPWEIEGRRIDLQQTKDTAEGMLLCGAAERGYVGFIVFKEVAR